MGSPWQQRASGYVHVTVRRTRYPRWRSYPREVPTMVVRGELGKTKQERRGRVVPLAPVLEPDDVT